MIVIAKQSQLSGGWRVTWGGFWNTTVGLDVNYPEVQVSGAGVKGRVSDGWYLEYKPGRVLTYVLAGQVIAVAIILGYEALPIIGGVIGELIRQGGGILQPR